MARARLVLQMALCWAAAFSACAETQVAGYPKPSQLPNPYRLVEGWPDLPKSMNGGHWGEVIRVSVDKAGHIWVFHRCFNTEPAGHATCVRRGPGNPPILEFTAAGKLIRGFGNDLFAYPHAFTIAPDGALWASDVNDEATVLGLPATNAKGQLLGQEVLKLSPATGKVLMMLGKLGVSGEGKDGFDRPTGVAVAANGDVFVSDGHDPNRHNASRVVKFDAQGRFLMAWGRKGSAPGEFSEPHDIAIGGSKNRVYVADRGNARIQVFDQQGHFIAAWPQFGEPHSVFVDKDDTIYVGATYPAEKGGGAGSLVPQAGEARGIVIGSAKDGSLKAFIPDPGDMTKVVYGSSASGIAVDAAGAIYAADVGTHNLRKYVLAR